MTDNRCGIDFRIEDGEEEKILEMEPETPGVDLEIAGTEAAELEAAGSEEPAEMELPEDEEPAELDVGDAVIISDVYPEYDGPTTVVSRIGEEQVLKTALRTVMQDIEIERIPVWEVSNPAGGVTVTIGRN